MRNKYAGTCYRCGKPVAPYDGHFEKVPNGWRTQHADCCIKHRELKEKADAFIEASRNTQRGDK